jgi:16S rRNA (guanine966-N2)-methyltransferase
MAGSDKIENQAMQRKNRQKTKARGAPPGRLRIVAGKWRSRLLPVADVAGLRPTSERVRETLFNWLAPVIDGARCLDLYAGSGALGIEAMSRGAASVEFVENSRLAASTLRDSIEVLAATNAIVREVDARAFLKTGCRVPFNLVFLDPPFATDCHEELCRLLADHGWLAKGAQVYLEQHSSQQLPELPDGWVLLKEKTAGNVRYSLIRAA